MTGETRRYGVYRAIVASNSDPEARGRVQIETPSLSELKPWADVAIFATCEANPPPALAMGDEVVVAFEAGDPERPIVIGRFWERRG